MNSRLFVALLLLVLIGPFQSLSSATGVQCLSVYDPDVALYDLVRKKGDEYEVVVPRNVGDKIKFEYKLVSDLAQVETAFSGISLFERQIAKLKLEQYVAAYGPIVNYFEHLSKAVNATFKHRLKKIMSLRDKIIEKAEESAGEGKAFSFDRLDDFIGIRLMFDPGSDFLTPLSSYSRMSEQQVLEFYTKKLGFDKSGGTKTINKIEFKGQLDDQQKGRFYRAVHLSISIEGVPVELQIMTRSVALWHFWDHPKAYKPETSDPEYKKSLKLYSRFWIRFIRAVEDFKAGESDGRDMVSLLSQYRLDAPVEPGPNGNSVNWFLYYDRALAAYLGIAPSDRFLGKDSIVSQSSQRFLFKEMSRIHYRKIETPSSRRRFEIPVSFQ